ncbi:MAG: hypothetical protein R6U95_10045 [Bacteroidales bacterium]
MKKVISLLIVSVSISFASHAQVFIGGNISLNSNGGNTEYNPNNGSSTTTDNEKYFSFSLNPQAGIFLSEKVAVGSGINFGISKETESDDNYLKTTSFGISPFLRYYIFEYNKFSLFSTGTIHFSTSTTKYTESNVTTDGPRRNTFSLSVTPSVSYKLSESFHVEAGLDFMNLGISSTATKTEDGDGNENIVRDNNFDFNANSHTLFTTGSLTIGLIYFLESKTANNNTSTEAEEVETETETVD